MKNKLLAILTLLCMSVMGWAYDQDTAFPNEGSYEGQFKWYAIDGVTAPMGVNSVESKDGFDVIFVNVGQADFDRVTGIIGCEAITEDGAGVWIKINSLTKKNNEIYFKNSGGTTLRGLIIYNDKGEEESGAKTASELAINSTAETLDATTSETFQIAATQSGDGAISYESSNVGVASVNNTGLVTAVGRGTATITVRTAETATYAASSKTLTVTVTGPLNWATEPWIGNGSGDDANTEKWKMAEHNYVNIQKPDFASEAGIYAEFAAPIVYCSLGEGNYDIQGAGMCMHLSAFTAEVTEVLVIGNHIQHIFYVYKDGASGTINLNDIVPVEENDVNFALETNGGWASATSGTAWSANDGNEGTRWESASTDDETWTLDLGRRRIFNTIQILWEGAFCTEYELTYSTDGETYSPLYTETNLTQAGWQTIDVAKTTARYIKYHGTKRATTYGQSFLEFRVLLPGVSELTSIDLSAAAVLAEVCGAGVVLTAQPKDQNGQNMDETVSYEIAPVTAGHMSGNTYIPDQTGAATIRAYNGSIYSTEVTVVGYKGTNLALSTNISTDNKVVAQSEVTGDATDAFYAVDGDKGSVWQACRDIEDNKTNTDFTSFFTLDLGAAYEINLIAIWFDGAASDVYKIEFSTNNTDWEVGFGISQSIGNFTHQKYLTQADLDYYDKVRYVRFTTTKASTHAGWGMKMFEIEVYGTPWVDTGDTEAPEMVSATEDSKTWNSVVLAVSATDNVGVTGYRVVETAHGIDQDMVATDGKITITGLTAETEYTFVVTAKDAARLESAGMSVTVTTAVHQLAPTTAAPEPTWPAEQVKSLYSDTYAFAPSGLNSYNEGWWNNPGMTEGDVTGNHYLNYDLYRDGMIGVHFAETSMATMEKIHIDIWASASGTVTFRPIIVDDDDLNNNRKTLTLAALQWNSFDIDMSEFGAHNWTKVFQYSIEYYNAGGLVGEHICVDNVYFYRETPYVDAEAPTNVSATLLNTTYVSASIQVSAEDNSGAVLYTVKNGEVEVATGGGASGATVTIDVPNLTPGTTYTFSVIAKDDAGNEAAPAEVLANTLTLPAAAPIPDLAGKLTAVIFCDAIAGGPEINIGGWGQSTVATSIPFSATDNVFYFRNFNYLGFELAPAVNAKDMQYLHVDVYAPNITEVGITPISPGKEKSTLFTLNPGQWTSLDIPLSVYESAGIAWDNVYQFKFDQGSGTGELFIDNVYFYKEPDFNRTDMLGNGVLGTICLEYNVLYASGAVFYDLVGKDEAGKIVFDEVTGELLAGKPYVFQATGDELNIYYGDTHATEPDNTGALQGTFTERLITIDDSNRSNIYYFANQALWGCLDLTTLTVPANRAYLLMDKVTPAPAPKPGIRRITMNVNGTNTATGIEQMTDGQTLTTQKVLIDGNLFILRGEKIYNANGVRVK